MQKSLRPIKVLLVNNYSMENAYALWKSEKSGSHHVWGKVELERRGDIEVEIFRHEKFRFLNKLGKMIGIKHLDQQVRVLGHKNYDILFAPYALANTSLLVLLKWAGLYKKPIVATIHQPFLGTRSKNKLWKNISAKALLQYDSSIFLSEALMKDAVERLEIPPHIVEEKFRSAQWGPDTEFYKKNLPTDIPLKECTYAVSAGHTDRDYVTLIEAFRHIDFPLKIYCTPETTPKVENLPGNVTINSKKVPYVELLEIYSKAKMILTPMVFPEINEGCQGMTSVQDVVALGKPTIMTRNDTLNLDIEKEGFGQYVEMGDVQGWVTAVNNLIHNENLLNSMQENARRVYKNKFNSEIFALTLEREFMRVTGRQRVKA